MIRALCCLFALIAPALAHAGDRTIMLSGFDRIRVDGPFAVQVTTDENAGAVVSGDMRAAESVDVHVEGRTLIVAASPNDWGGWPGKRQAAPTIRVTTRIVEGAYVVGGGTLAIDRMEAQRADLSVTGAGTITVADGRMDALLATLAGSGTITIAGTANTARFNNSGAGTIDATGLSVDDLTVRSDGPGQSMFAAERTADVTATGLGSVTVAGDPSCTVHGSGPVHCGEPRN